MQKVFSVLAALVIALSMSAAERGKFIHVDNTVNKNLKPQLAFRVDHKDSVDVTTMLVKMVSTSEYYSFTDASRVLIRLSNDKTIRLNRNSAAVSKEKKYSEKKGTATITFYPTITEYEVTPELIEALENGQTIVKVRIVPAENEKKDYDIVESYQARFSSDLLKSYQEAVQNNRKAHSDISDEDF